MSAKFSTPALMLILLLGGTLMGYGARWGGGCTTGHDLCGTSVLSPGSIVATGMFMSTAVIVTWLIHLTIGGAL